MKTLRIAGVLYLYERLLFGKSISANDAIEQLQVSPTTFKRMVSDLRCYLMEYHPEEELVYQRNGNEYRLASLS